MMRRHVPAVCTHASAAAMIAGCLGPWTHVGPLTAGGLAYGTGQFTMLLAVTAVISAHLPRLSSARLIWPAIASCAVLVIIARWGARLRDTHAQVASVADDMGIAMPAVAAGWGVWAAIAGAAVMLVVALMRLCTHKSLPQA